VSALEVFAHNGWSVRTELRDGEPWFVAVDVCKALGLDNASKAVTRLDADGVSTAEVIDSMGRTQSATVVDEGALYELIFQSRRPEAAEFRRWVTREVLPAIRRTGSYSVAPVDEIPSHAESLRGWADAVERAERAEERVEQLAPQAAMAMALIDSAGDYSVRDAAQILARDNGIDLGAKRLFDFLRTISWIDKGKRPSPYQSQIACGRLAVRSTTFTDADGIDHVTRQVRITPKGLAELHRRLGGGPTLALVSGGLS
jgi:anti-repressor protein